MSKRKGSGSGAKAILLLALIAVTIALLFYAKYGTPPQPSEESSPVPAQTNETETNKPPVGIRVPRPTAEGGAIKWVIDPVPAKAGEDPVQFAVNRFLESTHIAPEGAKVLSVRYEQGVAILDFSPEFARTYSTDDEHTLLKGIFESVRLNSNAKYLRLMAGGKPIESLGGYDLTTEQPVGLFAKE